MEVSIFSCVNKEAVPALDTGPHGSVEPDSLQGPSTFRPNPAGPTSLSAAIAVNRWRAHAVITVSLQPCLRPTDPWPIFSRLPCGFPSASSPLTSPRLPLRTPPHPNPQRERRRRRLALHLDVELAPEELAAGEAVVRFMYTQVGPGRGGQGCGGTSTGGGEGKGARDNDCRYGLLEGLDAEVLGQGCEGLA